MTQSVFPSHLITTLLIQVSKKKGSPAVCPRIYTSCPSFSSGFSLSTPSLSLSHFLPSLGRFYQVKSIHGEGKVSHTRATRERINNNRQQASSMEAGIGFFPPLPHRYSLSLSLSLNHIREREGKLMRAIGNTCWLLAVDLISSGNSGPHLFLTLS